jgi:hypothetical protein
MWLKACSLMVEYQAVILKTLATFSFAFVFVLGSEGIEKLYLCGIQITPNPSTYSQTALFLNNKMLMPFSSFIIFSVHKDDKRIKCLDF